MNAMLNKDVKQQKYSVNTTWLLSSDIFGITNHDGHDDSDRYKYKESEFFL